jgi:hypothetical protein
MTSSEVATLDDVVVLASKLTPSDKARLIERIAVDLQREVSETGRMPSRSLYGICADLGSAPSAEEIDEARREEWASFPREDI